MMYPYFGMLVNQLPMRTHDMLQVVLNGKVQTGLVARPQLGGSGLSIPRGVDGADGVNYVLPKSK